jgi:hypothetical protein
MKKICIAICTITLLMLPGLLHAQLPNTLTEQEKKDGWVLLFNGKNLTGWHSFHDSVPSKGWKVNNGIITRIKTADSKPEDYRDLVTDKEYANFDFKVDWMIEPGANSGVMFYVNEGPQFHETYESGPEMQITDLYVDGDSRIHKCRAGCLYDLIEVDTEWVTIGGKWNTYEIKCVDGHLQFFQNGHQVVETQMWGDDWRKMIAATKFSAWPGFGTFKKGHISFQGTEYGKIYFRNIKIKEL